MLPEAMRIGLLIVACGLAGSAPLGCADDDDDGEQADAGIDGGDTDADTDSDSDSDTDTDADSDGDGPPNVDDMIWPFDISKIEWANIPDGGAADGGLEPSYEFFEGKVVLINCFQSW